MKPILAPRCLTDEVIEREGGVTAASIVVAGGVLADLACFEGVHAGEANALATDLDRVTIDQGGLADDRFGGGGRRQDRQR